MCQLRFLLALIQITIYIKTLWQIELRLIRKSMGRGYPKAWYVSNLMLQMSIKILKKLIKKRTMIIIIMIKLSLIKMNNIIKILIKVMGVADSLTLILIKRRWAILTKSAATTTSRMRDDNKWSKWFGRDPPSVKVPKY